MRAMFRVLMALIATFGMAAAALAQDDNAAYIQQQAAEEAAREAYDQKRDADEAAERLTIRSGPMTRPLLPASSRKPPTARRPTTRPASSRPTTRPARSRPQPMKRTGSGR